MSFRNEIIIKHIIIEGRYAHNPTDPGKETYKGIARVYNADWAGWHIIDSLKGPHFPGNLEANQELQDLVVSRYVENYWNPLKLDLITKRLVAEEMFDQGAGPQGIKAAVTIAQGALLLLKQNVTLDGIMGQQTANALNNYQDETLLVNFMNLLQWVHFLIGSANMLEFIEMVKPRLGLVQTFIKGWTKNRITI